MSEKQDQSPQEPEARLPLSKEAIARAEQAMEGYQTSSYWPFMLAVAIVVTFMGLITHPIVMGIGVVLIVAAIIGWGFERR